MEKTDGESLSGAQRTEQKTKLDELQDDLKQFIGSEDFYLHSASGLIYTDGIKALAEFAQAYWLIDAIGSYCRKTRDKPFTLWRLYIRKDRSALLTAREDSGLNPFIEQEIQYTDFPGPGEVEIYQENKTILLKSEH